MISSLVRVNSPHLPSTRTLSLYRHYRYIEQQQSPITLRETSQLIERLDTALHPSNSLNSNSTITGDEYTQMTADPHPTLRHPKAAGAVATLYQRLLAQKRSSSNSRHQAVCCKSSPSSSYRDTNPLFPQPLHSEGAYGPAAPKRCVNSAWFVVILLYH